MKNPSLITSLAILLSCLSSSLNAQTTNGLQLWLKPEGLTNTVAASPISFWTDSSGGNYHATNNTGIKQPTYSTNALNGYAVAHFTGDGLVSANLNYLQSPLPFNSAYTNFTAIIVYKTTFPAGATARCQLIHQASGFANLYILASATTTNLFTSAANTAGAGTPITTGAWKIATVVEDSTSIKVYENGVLLETKALGTVVSNNISGWVFGARQNKTAYGLNGDIAEILIYNTNLSTTAQITTEDYLFNKYGIPVILSDNFNTADTTDLNADLATRQSGTAATANYFTTGFAADSLSITNNQLKLKIDSGFSGFRTVEFAPQVNFITNESGNFKLSYDITSLTQVGDCWAGIVIRSAPQGIDLPQPIWGDGFNTIIRSNGASLVFPHGFENGPPSWTFGQLSATNTLPYHVELIATNNVITYFVNSELLGSWTLPCASANYITLSLGSDNNNNSATFDNFAFSATIRPPAALPVLTSVLKLLDSFNTADSNDLNLNLARQSGPVAPVSWTTNGNLNSAVSITGNALLLTNSPGGGQAIGMASPTGDFRQYEHLNSFRISYTVQGTNNGISNDSWIGTRFRDNAPSHFVADADGGGTGINFFSGDGRWYLWQSYLGLTNTSGIAGSGSVPVAASYAFEFEVRTNLLRIKINGQPLALGCGALPDAYLLSTAQVNNFVTLHCFAGGSATAAFAQFDDFKFESLDPGFTVAAPTILNPALAGSNFSFNLNSVSPIFYAVDSKTDLAAPTWTYLGGLVGNGGSVSYTNTTATNSAQFYRLRIP